MGNLKGEGKALKFASEMKLLQKILDVISSIDYDDLTITLTGTVKDLEKSSELKEKFPFGKVGLDYYNGKPKAAEFVMSENIKDVTKSIIKKWKDYDKLYAALRDEYLLNSGNVFYELAEGEDV